MVKKVKVVKAESNDMKCADCGCESCEACNCEECNCEECMGACDCEGSCAYGPCRCPHHYVLPAMGAIFGALFLMNALGLWITDYVLSIAWPIIVIAASIFFATKDRCGCCSGCC